MLNGGCSHKCVNTEGDFKCECPDPELSLSSDRRTCYGNYDSIGVTFHVLNPTLKCVSLGILFK